MKTFYLTILFSVLVSTSIFAQQKEPTMSFDVLNHDYGAILQKDGLANYTFEFTNTGGEPIIINNVDASCGCTTPDWTKAPIGPGAKGTIKVAFDPRNRPGHFSKTITIFSNADNSPIKLTITGNVTEKQNTIEESYPQKINELRIDNTYLNFGNIFNDKTNKEMELLIYNPTDKEMKIVVEDRYKPAYTTITVEPEILQPEQSGSIKVVYDASKVNDWDYVRGFIYLTIDGVRVHDRRIQVSAVIKEKFTAAQLLNPPVIEFDNPNFDFDTINQGEIIVHKFTFKNTGKSDLVIRKTRTSCGCTAVSLSDDPVKPGETGVIKATFNSTHKTNKQTKTITVITNCPNIKYNKVILKITGFVIPKK